MPILNNDKVKIINDSIKASPGPTSVLQCVNHGLKYDKQWALMVWERMAHTARPPAEWMSEVHAQRIEINVGTAALYSYDLYLCRKVTGNWFSLVITRREEQRRESNWINTARIVKHDTGILINIQTPQMLQQNICFNTTWSLILKTADNLNLLHCAWHIGKCPLRYFNLYKLLWYECQLLKKAAAIIFVFSRAN